MPNMFGGDQMSEDYAPAAYLCGHFVGFDSKLSRWVGGCRYTFALTGKKIICGKSRRKHDDGKEIPFDEVPDDVIESVLRIQLKPDAYGLEYKEKLLEAIRRRYERRA